MKQEYSCLPPRITLNNKEEVSGRLSSIHSLLYSRCAHGAPALVQAERGRNVLYVLREGQRELHTQSLSYSCDMTTQEFDRQPINVTSPHPYSFFVIQLGTRS